MMMTIGRFATKFQLSTIAVLVLASAWPSRAMAQDDHSHMISAGDHNPTPEQKKQQNALVQEVRRVTAQFQHHPPSDRALVFGCVSGGDFGAMGMHFLKGSVLNDGEVQHRRSRDFSLRAAAQWQAAIDGRRLSGVQERLGGQP